jgi:hypothetical protein
MLLRRRSAVARGLGEETQAARTRFNLADETKDAPESFVA